MQEFNSISKNRKNIFFIVLRQSRASTRKSRSGLFYYGFALASRAGIFFVNASHQAEPGRNSRSGLSFFILCLYYIKDLF